MSGRHLSMEASTSASALRDPQSILDAFRSCPSETKQIHNRTSVCLLFTCFPNFPRCSNSSHSVFSRLLEVCSSPIIFVFGDMLSGGLVRPLV